MFCRMHLIVKCMCVQLPLSLLFGKIGFFEGLFLTLFPLSQQNLPFSVENKWRLLAMMTVYFGSGFAAPFFIVRHQLLKK